MNARCWVAAWLLAGLAQAQAPLMQLDCANLKLVDAIGAGDAAARQHTYRFSGSCRLYVKTGHVTEDVRTLPIRAVGSWDAIDKRFTESVQIAGSFQWSGRTIGGEMSNSFRCNDDPLLAQSACNGFAHSNRTGLEAMSNSYKQHGRPLLVGRCTPAQVLALSARHMRVRK